MCFLFSFGIHKLLRSNKVCRRSGAIVAVMVGAAAAELAWGSLLSGSTSRHGSRASMVSHSSEHTTGTLVCPFVCLFLVFKFFGAVWGVSANDRFDVSLLLIYMVVVVVDVVVEDIDE